MAIKKTSSHNAPPIPFTPISELPSMMAILVYGRSGTGKTTFASTAPKPMLLLDVREKGTDSVANVPGIDVAHIEKWDDFVQVYWYLAKGNHKYKTVCVDQVSQLQDLAIIQAMTDNGKKESDPIAKRDWGQAAGLMKTWLLSFRDLMDNDLHVIFLAHDRTVEMEEGSEDQIDPSVGARVMPSVASFLYGAVKIIGNSFIKESFTIQDKRKVRKIDYAMRIGPNSVYVTKTRNPVGIIAPDLILNPTFEKIMKVMKGTYQPPK